MKRSPRRTYSYGAVDNVPKSGSNLSKLDENGTAEERAYSLSTSAMDENVDQVAAKFKAAEKKRHLMAPPYLFSSVESLMDEEGEEDEEEGEPTREGGTQEPGRKTVMSHKQKVTVGMLACANLASTVVFSCIAPFFPAEAQKKGASETATGMVFGIFELVIFLTSPLFGRYMTKIGSKFMYGAGLFSTGVTAILFGLLNLAPNGTTFVVLCFVVRSVEAVGDAAFITASFAITAYAFPHRVATVIGLLETFSGLGFTVGPPVGGALFELGGFQLPFWVLGSLLIVAGLTAFCVIPKQNDKPTGKVSGSVYSLLRFPEIDLMVLSIVVTAATLSFLDPTLAPHLSSFNLTPFLVGLMFLLTGGVYTITAPFWGYLIDKKNCGRQVMVFGSICSAVSLMFIGPSPIWGIKKKRGFSDGFETYGLVSGLFQASMSLGAFIGPTLGGVSVDYIGFEWSTTILAGLFVVVGIILIIYLAYDYRKEKAALRAAFLKASTDSLLSLDK